MSDTFKNVSTIQESAENWASADRGARPRTGSDDRGTFREPRVSQPTPLGRLVTLQGLTRESPQEMPLRTAWTAAWMRLSRCSFDRMLATWLWMVFLLSESSSAMS